MVTLLTLGAIDLRAADGTELRAVLRQPKRLGLLVYLLLGASRRFHRRDALLALFWPELDQDHARAALRRSLYFLRRSLGDELLDARGDEEVGVREGAIWCDAVAFEQALAGGDRAGAMGIYRGDLLESFFVAGAPEVERWLDAERRRLRELAARAAWQLAEASDADRATIAAWARRAAALTPDDEMAARRLIATLTRAGDRTGALQAYEEFARRLATDFELEPSAETRRLVDAARAGVAEQRVAFSPTPLTAPAAEPDVPHANPDVVAVMPFSVRGGPDYSYLSKAIMDLLSTALDGAGTLRALDPQAIRAELVRADTATDPDAGHALAQRLGAGLYVRGAIVEAGGTLRIRAVLCDMDSAPLCKADAQADSEAKIFSATEAVARGLLVGRWTGSGGRLVRIAAATARSLTAFKAYLLGEQAFRAGRYAEAIDAFGRAAAEDPGFALAHHQQAVAYAASARIGPARDASAKALQRADTLLEHDRLVLEAQNAWLAGDATAAERRLEAAVADDPGDPAAWFLLADVRYHGNPYRGRTSADARVPLERVLGLSPNDAGALVRLARIEAMQGRYDRFDEVLTRVLASSPEGDHILPLRALRAYALGEPAEQRAVGDALVAAPGVVAAIAVADVALYSGKPAGAAALASRLAASAPSTELRALCELLAAHLALARGRVADAFRDLKLAEAHDRGWSLELRGFFAALPFLALPESEIAAARDTLNAWDAGSAPRSLSVPLALHDGLHHQLQAYVLGLLAARLGQSHEVERHLRQLATMGAPAGGEALVERLQRSLEGQLRRASGDAAGALAALEAEPAVWFQLAIASPFYAGALDRFTRAELLSEAGRTSEALGWWTAIAERTPWELAFAAPAAARAGEAYERLGDREAALREYRRFVEWWTDGDPPLASEAEQIRERMERMQA